MTVPYNPEIMRTFGFWAGILTLKLLAMSPLTGRLRFKKKVFADKQDAEMLGMGRAGTDDEDIERVRRSHRNDLENFLPWALITYLYLGTGPSNWTASLVIRGFVFSRFLHTLSYAIYPQQPLRFLSFACGFGLTAYQAISTISHYS